MQTGINLNGSVEIKNVKEIRQAIIDIAKLNTAEVIKLKALEVLETAISKAGNVHVGNCNIDGSRNVEMP